MSNRVRERSANFCLQSLFCSAILILSGSTTPARLFAQENGLPPVSEDAKKVHDAGMLFDGHNDLPWRLHDIGDMGLTKFNLNERNKAGQTDIPRLREGGLKVQFWSVYIPSEHPNPARTVTQQIDLVHRMIDKYPQSFELALDADDIERIVHAGKIASLIGIEGGVAIENDLAQLRAFYQLGARYMTLTHNTTLDWADAANDKPKHDGLTDFGERVVKEMNRLGMLVDISHVSAATMADVLRVSRAPIIASHSSAFALCPVPRNVPDDILKLMKQNGGVIMVNFNTGFIVPNARRKGAAKPEGETKAAGEARRRGTVGDVVDHIEHIIKVAGIDHVGIGSDFDGIVSWPVGLDSVADYPRLTEELLKRGYSGSDIHKILGGNALRAFRVAGEVSKKLRATTEPEVGQLKPVKK